MAEGEPTNSQLTIARAMRPPWKSYFVVGTMATVVAMVMLFLYASDVSERIGRKKSGINLRRLDNETIRISWGTGSGVNISPEGTLTFKGFELETALKVEEPHESAWALPPLSTQSGIWMYLLEPDAMAEAVPASYVNPKLDGAVDRMFHMLALRREGNQNTELLTRLAAQSYIYPGYVVLNEDDATALSTALSDRSKVNLDEDIVTPGKRLHRLRAGVEQNFVANPNDKTALAEMRKRIPVMFESVNTKAGHPADTMSVLYLDGHVEIIPYGERFPALSSVMKAFPSPPTGE